MGPAADDVIEEGTMPVAETVPNMVVAGQGSCCEVTEGEESSKEDLHGCGQEAQEQGQEGTECNVHMTP